MKTPTLTTHLLRSALLVACGSFFVGDLHAQTPAPKLEFPQASPAASVKERVGLTDIEITYARPSAKGRKVFGGLIAHDEIWRTGANSATSITFGTDVTFGGAPVPAGTYALFTIPNASEWTVILNKGKEQWGSYQYDEKQDLVRVKAKPVALTDMVETLQIGLTDFTSTSAHLQIAWEKTRVPIKIEVDLVKQMKPRIDAAMAESGKKPYLSAAMFYYDHNLDLKTALAWIDEAAKEQPGKCWITYRKGLILAKMGDKKGAIAAATQSLEEASKAEGGLKAEYTRLNEALLASLR